MRQLALPAAIALALAAPAAALAAPNVVATFLPVHGIVSAIMAGVGTPALLIDTPVSPHTYALTPSKRRVLDDADLVIGIGPGMEAGIWEAIEEIDAEPVALMEFIDAHLIRTAETMAHDHDGDGIPDHAPEGHPGADADRVDAAGLPHEADPHIWLDTAIAADLGEIVARILADADPENATRYFDNAKSFHQAITGLDAELAVMLPDASGKIAVNYHDAFAYFARQWRLHYDFVVPEPDMAPSAGKVAELRQHAQADEIACLMTEPQFQPDLLVELADDYGLRILEIDPEGALIAPGPDAYLTLMRRIGATFAACLDP